MPKPNANQAVLSAAAAIAVLAVDAAGAPLKRMRLLPMGELKSRDGRAWRVKDLAHAQRIVANTQAYLKSTDLPGDYDHQLVFAAGPGKGGVAPASGWIDPATLTAEPDGIYGDVSWTAAAEQKIRAREYRYISPVIFHDKQLNVTGLKNFALTNQPALDDLAAAAAAQEQEPEMSLTAIAKALSLGEDATESACLQAIATLKTTADTATAALATAAKAVGLKDDAAGDEIAAAAVQLKQAGAPDPAQFAPMAVVETLQTQLKTLQDAQAAKGAETAVAAAMAAGKISPAMKGWAEDYAATDPDGFAKYVAAAAVVVPIGKRQLEGKPPADDTAALSEDDKQLCATMGWSEEAFLAERKKETA